MGPTGTLKTNRLTRGLAGTVGIRIGDGQHFYSFEYCLGGAARVFKNYLNSAHLLEGVRKYNSTMEERIMELESRVAFQDQTIRNLDEVVRLFSNRVERLDALPVSGIDPGASRRSSLLAIPHGQLNGFDS